MGECVRVGNEREYVNIEVIGYENLEAECREDANWLTCSICVVAPSSGISLEYRAAIMTDAFRAFAKEVRRLIRKGTGIARFKCLEDCVELSLSAGETGYYRIQVMANPYRDSERKSSCVLGCDRPGVVKLAEDLRQLRRKFPVKWW